MPFTLKSELIEDQHARPPYGSNLTYPVERYTRITQTSSTTGKPLHWLDTPESWAWMLDNWVRVYRAGGVTMHDRVFFGFSFGMFLGFWTAFEAAVRLGCLCIPGGGMSSGARLAAMLDNGATVLCCTPTYALRLAEVAADEGIDLAASKVRRIIVGADGPCACGSGEMSLPGGILARIDDMLVVRGVNVCPSAVEEVLRACDGIAEYRVEIHAGHPLPELRVLVEPAAGCGDVGGLEK